MITLGQNINQKKTMGNSFTRIKYFLVVIWELANQGKIDHNNRMIT